MTLYEMHATNVPLRRICCTLRIVLCESLATSLNCHSMNCTVRIAVYVKYVALYEMHPANRALRRLIDTLRSALYERTSTSNM